MEEISERAPKRVFLETFGCQMNDNDSERMLDLLQGIDYVRTGMPESADLILLNTCSIRDKAEQKVYSTLGRFKAIKETRPGIVIGVTGCVAQQHGETLLKRAPYLDMVLGPHNVHRLGELIEEVAVRKKRVVATELRETIEENEYDRTVTSEGLKANVSIMRGCDNFCSYCIVPYTRGREVSRHAPEIVREVRTLAETGIREVTLLGQNVNSYGANGCGGVGFTELLGRVCRIDGIERVRFITSNPKDIPDSLVELFEEESELCRHVHLPVQSGSDQVLKAMRRGYTRSEYLDKVLRLKSLYPDMALTTDVIVGFPGESDACFSETIDLIERVRFDNIFSFAYSPRSGTAAAELDGQIPVRVRSERLKLLQERQREITTEERGTLLGKTLEVLAEGPSKSSAAHLTGRTTCNRIVNFAAPAHLAGSLVDVTITEVLPNSMRGSLMATVDPVESTYEQSEQRA